MALTRFFFDGALQNDNTYKSSSISDKDSDNESVKSHESAKYDTTAATYLDIAVLRCLFILHWQEDGVYWCLHYIYNRYVCLSSIGRILLDHDRTIYKLIE